MSDIVDQHNKEISYNKFLMSCRYCNYGVFINEFLYYDPKHKIFVCCKCKDGNPELYEDRVDLCKLWYVE